MVPLKMGLFRDETPRRQTEKKKGSPFSEEQLTALGVELQRAYQKITEAGGKISPYVCPAELPVSQIARPEEIIRICRMDADTAKESYLRTYDCDPREYHKDRTKMAISLFAYKKLGATVPESVESHITRAIGNIDASDAVELIRDMKLWPYDSERKNYALQQTPVAKAQTIAVKPMSTAMSNREAITAVVASILRRSLSVPTNQDPFNYAVDKTISLKEIDFSKAELDELRFDMVEELKAWIYFHGKSFFSRKEYEAICSAKREGKLEKDVNKNINLLVGKGVDRVVADAYFDFYQEYVEGRLVPFLERKRYIPYKAHPRSSEAKK